MALCAGARNIATVATNLSEMFRYTIQEKNMATIAEEMAIAEKYMQVMNARYDQRFHYSSRTEEGLEEIRIPRMVIQPLLENAILHGFSGSLDQGRSTWSAGKPIRSFGFRSRTPAPASRPNRLIKFGNAMNEAFSLDTRIRDDSLGLRNIHQRIATLYGPAYGVSIESRPGFTRVWLTIPSLDEENVL
jgi:two-component system sensor histidine kinase YesM